MKIKIGLLFSLIFLSSALSCSSIKNQEVALNEEESWHLSYRMFVSNFKGETGLGVKQFDSLLQSNTPLEPKFVKLGIELLLKNKDAKRVAEVFNASTQEAQSYTCTDSGVSALMKEANLDGLCKDVEVKEEAPTHPEVQKELVIMYYNDQSVRGTDMAWVLKDYELNGDSISYNLEPAATDAKNQEKLKALIEKHGFPTKSMVGAIGMSSAFLTIQHSDNDVEFQKSQFKNIEQAVKQGDMEGQKYAYLYDRIKVNSGEPQLYGTQFLTVDVENNITELQPVEDIDNLDKRRRELGMMPIEIYKELMLYHLKKEN